MERKNIFQLIEENYNIDDEIKKINRLFEEQEYFVKKTFYGFDISPSSEDVTFVFVLENYLFSPWKRRGTCVDIEEYFKRCNARIDPENKVDEETATNYVEAMLNLIKLFRDNYPFLLKEAVDFYTDFEDVFCPLVETLKKRLGLAERVIDDAVIVYPENAPLEQVLDVTTDQDAQWELIRYCRENMDLAEKRKSLAYFATAFYIEEDKNDDQATKLVVNKATNILNNLHIRHNNQTGKYEKEYLKDISEEEALSLCDLLYNQILTIILLREQRKYDKVYKAFKDKQKGV
ncbi:MAG: hypothetical protein K2O44_00905 [Clostridia bacterium]|nr:hypothetical protein [Clostridia bacterium]